MVYQIDINLLSFWFSFWRLFNGICVFPSYTCTCAHAWLITQVVLVWSYCDKCCYIQEDYAQISKKKQETESLHSIFFSAIFWYNLSKLLKFMPRINGELLQFCAIWHFIWIGWICLVSLGLILETIEGGKDIKIVPGIKINVPVIFFLLYYIGTQNK